MDRMIMDIRELLKEENFNTLNPGSFTFLTATPKKQPTMLHPKKTGVIICPYCLCRPL
jgi:hypothetical protein